MKFPFWLLMTVVLFGCETKPVEIEPSKIVERPTLTQEQIFKRCYDITDLSVYDNDQKFIARLTIHKRYNKTFLVELTELSEAIYLTVKVPIGGYNTDSYDPYHSSLFDQVNYYFEGKEAIKIKKDFLTYKIDSVVNDISCKGCLEPEPWTVEIYDHGKYTSITKDDMTPKDLLFIDDIMKKVKIAKKNGYQILH